MATASIVTENYCRLNFTPKSGVTPGTNDTLAMSCDQIAARYNVTISGVTTTGNRCPAQNELTAVSTLAVGNSHQGGIIAYIFQSGDPGYISGQVHGIIAAASDIAGNLPWATSPFLITNATSFELSDGDNNTTIIVAVNGTTTTYAARICNELSLNGYSDWCLPSMNELLKLSYNKLIIGGFSSLFYWSSTEIDRYKAYGVNFSGTGSNNSSKGGSARVRAIRYF